MNAASELKLGILTSCGPMLCTCGRLATETFATEEFGTVGYCGQPGRQPLDPCTCGFIPTVHDAAYCDQKRGNVIYKRTRIHPTDVERARVESDLIKADFRRRGELDRFTDAEVEEIWTSAYWTLIHYLVEAYQERDGR